MAIAPLDVVGIGNAIVDIIAHADDAFIARQGMTKGAMTLIDAARAEEVYAAMGPGLEMSGGSAGNTIAGVALLGGSAGYIGKVRDDQLGAVFRHDLTSLGVRFTTAPLTSGLPTARSMILVTPDAERTMHTFLGACVELGPEDVDPALIRDAQVTYLEGYLYDPPRAQEAFGRAAEIAHSAGRRVSLSLSDPFCVGRHRQAFRSFIAGHVDVLFANEVEILSLFETDDLAVALDAVSSLCAIAAVTRGAKGSVVVTPAERVEVPAAPVARVVDTTGAGDLYAAGFLHGLTTERPLATCARLGGVCAAEVISHYGARPEASLKDLVKDLVAHAA
ncbi:MAG TPA: adenosine kinase [Stellaceae bacterium]|nr:adenosine kinase [Stellaceae bacterium]